MVFALRTRSSRSWLEAVLSDFDSFLIDHAACERKASATALTFVSHYPDRRELANSMIDLAKEELDHFHQVFKQIASRGLLLAPDYKDQYVGGLRRQMRPGGTLYFLDRLLVASIVEARGCERFGLIAEALSNGELKDLYGAFSRSEARHHQVFLRLAQHYFDAAEVRERLNELFDVEAELLSQLPARPALH